MPTLDEHILRILGEAIEPLFPSDITERLNHELGRGSAYTRSEVMTSLQGLTQVSF
jgi:hypothetical protein